MGGVATAERVTLAFQLVLSSPSVKAIRVSIFGSIVRCDLIADGIIQGVKEVNVSVPVVVRLEGTNVDQGRKMLADSGMDIVAAEDLTDAAKKGDRITLYMPMIPEAAIWWLACARIGPGP